jgi:NADH:ubiquinone oxidoreductase subunit 5 (subunit L)/multisubunit Na+/H+ antiporter MnhA subunit/multisubunit Na+/H+ antiporter MnhB subunit
MELALVLVPFALAAAIPLLGRRLPATRLNWILAGIMLALFGGLLARIPTLAVTGPQILTYPWAPQLGLAFTLYLDGLALLFALLITGIGAAIFLYAGYYLSDARRAPLFFAVLSAFTGSMLGLVLAGNLLLLFVFWELTSVTSFLLISYERTPAARAAGLQALVVTAGGGLALLAGLVILGAAAGSFELAAILSAQLQGHPWYAGMTILIALGCLTKSAQWPFHFWLPAGMTAPTPASAFLHSATMVKAGVFLLARLYPVLGDTALWTWGLSAVGLTTMLVGAAVAPRQHDLKAILAYATVSWLGALVLLLGQPGHHGYEAAMVGIVAHALYKSPLFMVAGAIDHRMGTRDIRRLGGLWRPMPAAAAITLASGLSMMGIFPLLGFVAKEALLEALIELRHPLGPLVLAGAWLAAALTVTAALILIWEPFAKDAKANAQRHEGEAGGHSSQSHHTSRLLLLGPGVIAAVALLAGLGLEGWMRPLFDLAAGGETELHLFAGLNTAFALSMGALALGAAAFLVRGRWRGWGPPLPSGQDVYGWLMGGLERVGDLALRTQDGKLSHYLAVILGVVGVLIALPGATYLRGLQPSLTLQGGADVMKAVLLLLALGATLASVIFKNHLLAALALGVSGYAIGGIFLLEPAPDVALVQVLVETLAVVLIIVMLSRISELKRRRATEALWGGGRGALLRDGLIATLVGGGVGAFAMASVVNRPGRDSTAVGWYLENAYPLAGVTDVVGAIVTDFRGADTLLEITVFSMAALGVLSVLALAAREGAAPPAPLPSGDAFGISAADAQRLRGPDEIATPLTRLGATLMLPFGALLALSSLLYAGDAPGDGFSAGVIGGISLALWYAVFGYEKTSRVLGRLPSELLVGAGLLLALLNAGLPLLGGNPFFAHSGLGDVPLPAGLHVSSATIFEVAILLTVFGSVVNIINAIANPSGRSPR